jgi:hypothetical protein
MWRQGLSARSGWDLAQLIMLAMSAIRQLLTSGAGRAKLAAGKRSQRVEDHGHVDCLLEECSCHRRQHSNGGQDHPKT